jgi:formiminotetrahydrofolate cyclodeaminase
MAENTLTSLAVTEFLKRLASAAPTPGGGAAAALCGALAAGLGQMVCELTAGKPKFAAVEDEVLELRTRFQRSRQLLERLVDEDAAAYGALSAAFRLPKADQTRTAQITSAADTAACVPLETATVAALVFQGANRLGEIGNPQLAADIEAARALAAAAAKAGAANVSANLPLVSPGRRTTLSDSLRRVLSRFDPENGPAS